MREAALLLHERKNIYRKAKPGCEQIIKHFKNDCVGSSFIIQISEILVQDTETVNPQKRGLLDEDT